MKLKAAFKNMCIMFTILTIFNSIYSLLNGLTSETHVHILARFIFCLIGFSSFIFYGKLKKYLLNQYIAGFVNYIMTVMIVFIFVWSMSFLEPLALRAYRGVFINVTVIYLIVSFSFWFKEKYII